MWVVETNGDVLRGVVAENHNNQGIITVYVDGYSIPYKYQKEFVFRKERRATEFAATQGLDDTVSVE